MKTTPPLPHGLRPAALLALCLSGSALAQPAFVGRWEGQARIPGLPLPLVLDIAASPAGTLSAWMTLPGRGVKGAALAAPQRSGEALRVDASAAMSPFGPPDPAPVLLLRQEGGRLVGEWQMGALSAPLQLERTGEAQPEPAPRNTPLSPALHGTWRGSYSINEVPRQVTLTLSADRAELLIVGRRRLELAFDRITQGPQFLSLEHGDTGIAIEGRWRTASGDIEGQFLQGPFELPLVLKKEARP